MGGPCCDVTLDSAGLPTMGGDTRAPALALNDDIDTAPTAPRGGMVVAGANGGRPMPAGSCAPCGAPLGSVTGRASMGMAVTGPRGSNGDGMVGAAAAASGRGPVCAIAALVAGGMVPDRGCCVMAAGGAAAAAKNPRGGMDAGASAVTGGTAAVGAAAMLANMLLVEATADGAATPLDAASIACVGRTEAGGISVVAAGGLTAGTAAAAASGPLNTGARGVVTGPGVGAEAAPKKLDGLLVTGAATGAGDGTETGAAVTPCCDDDRAGVDAPKKPAGPADAGAACTCGGAAPMVSVVGRGWLPEGRDAAAVIGSDALLLRAVAGAASAPTRGEAADMPVKPPMMGRAARDGPRALRAPMGSMLRGASPRTIAGAAAGMCDGPLAGRGALNSPGPPADAPLGAAENNADAGVGTGMPALPGVARGDSGDAMLAHGTVTEAVA